MSKRVLDVGNCGFDHGSLARMVENEFGAKAIAAHDAEEALRKARSGEYALVVVNRVLDSDGSSGLDIIESLKSDPATKDLPVMMITNYPDHQAKAVAAGAEAGFGKSTLHEPTTRERLAKYLA
jgi:CheY-like chemotaxis protein